MEEKIQELEQEYFYLEMKDHWDAEDYKYAAKLKEKINEIRKELKEFEC